jgi:uncharacterized secreted protein with C-terminal beta-propeller domain
MAPTNAAPAPSLNPGGRPRRGVAIALAGTAIAAAVTVGLVAGTGSTPAGAEGLERFGSCAELEAWATDAASSTTGGFAPSFEGGPATTAVFDTVGADIDSGAAADGAAPVAAPNESTSAEESSASGAERDSTGGTNVAVEGVDELDLVDRLDDRRALFASPTAVVLVDLEAGQRLGRVEVPYGAQISYDAEAGIAWIVSSTADGMGTEVRRVAVDGDELRDRGSWTTSGYLVTARRVDDLLHVVVTEGFAGPEGPLPFAGGPVPCDQVLHPVGPSDPSATLIATLPVGGDLEPVRSTEVVGSSSLVHVTTGAAYLATPQWDQTVSTTIHRFELDDLEHTGSGRVAGTLLNDLAMSDDGSHLRVAITAGGGGVGRPIAIEGDGGIGTGPTVVGGDVAVSSDGEATSDGFVGTGTGTASVTEEVAPPAPEPPVSETTLPDTTVPDTTIPGEPTTTVTEPPTDTTTTEVPLTTLLPETTTTEAVTTTTEAPPTTEPVDQPGPNDPLNRIYVLDTEGDLDVVGRTPWFGHPGETLQGVRFDGATAYAVTFLQTDPFYVVDLADPIAPRIAGEVELPGFSSYLHPVGGGKVVGFGPDGNGMPAAKLFDVSDPASPKVVDTVDLGGDAPVAYDRHAYTDLGGGRFATPVTRWDVTTQACAIPEGLPEGPAVDYACAPSAVTNEIVELQVDGSELREVSRTEVQLAEQASRVLPVDDGWAVLAGTTVALVDADGELRTSVDLT